jgi:hypothetical protein
MTDELVIEQETTVISDPRYPIGHFQFGGTLSDEEIQQSIQTIQEFPARLKKLVEKYSEQQLDTPYREDGWTIRQVVHHVADSHMNAYIRFKLALTEDKPTIKPYNQKAWAEMIDSKSLPVSVSISLLTALHERWTTILKAMDAEDFHRTFFHPEYTKFTELSEIVAMYAWHGNHHYAHIESIKPVKATPKAKKAIVKKSIPQKATAKGKSKS